MRYYIRYELMNITAISCFSTIVFHIWIIVVVFPFFTITLFVGQDNPANKIQALRKYLVDRCLIISVVRALVL